MELPKMEIPEIPDISTDIGFAEILEMRVKAYNSMAGKLTGYDCEICKNKGYIAEVVDENEVLAECRCLKVRDTLYRIKNSGLENQLRRCTFRNYEPWESWCEAVKNKVMKYAEWGQGFLFAGGQSGCGKTHLCTAAVGQLIKKGCSARYFVWRDDSPKLKALTNDVSYAEKIKDFKQTDVLYIDDLFKQKDDDAESVTNADVKLAFEIIDYRARNNLTTLISSNFTIDKIMKIDEALGSRIFDMSGEYCINIANDRRKNYRLRGVVL